MLFLGALLLCLQIVVGTTTSASGSATTTSSARGDPVITVPLAALSGDKFYNAYVSDVAVRLDLLQPDLWIPDPNYQLYCNRSNSSNTTATLSCNSDVTSRYGVLYEDYTTTFTDSQGTATATVDVVDRLENYVSIPYPNGIAADGEVAMADLYFVDSQEVVYPLDLFNFIYVNDTNMMAGGFGLANNPRGTGILNYLYNANLIESRGYSAFLLHDNVDDDAYGELLLGGVDRSMFTGDLVSFPVLPYEGLDSGSTLPTVLLTDLKVVNSNTSQSVSLLSGKSEPVLLDPRLSFNFLPLDVIIRLALQTNAFYNNERGEWIVKCSDVEDSNAEFHYNFGPLTIKAPLSSFLYGNLNDTGLRFSSGSKACLLNVSPSSYLGYSCLGLPFLTNAYFVMDNDGGNIALANKNTDHEVGTDLYTDIKTSTSDYLSGSSTSSSLPSLNPSASFIKSGSIPWATKVNTTQTDTMTFGSANSTAAEAILTRYSQASIISGEVIVTREPSSTVGPTTHISSDSLSSTAAAGPGIVHWEHGNNEKILIYSTILIFGFLGGLII